MPNWCTNEVDILGSREVIAEIAEIVKANPQGIFQMNDFIPMPEELRETTAPRDKPNWYDWSISNWGTKWDLGDETQMTLEAEKIGLGFDTAWSPNCDFWTAFSEKYPSLRISHKYYEEGMCFIGEAFYEGGAFFDNCQDLTTEMYVKAGAVLDEEGYVDWDQSDINIFDIFPLGTGENK
jgi:hypothetical protein